MLTLSGSLRVFLALEPCDMRKSFDGLHALVVTRLGDDPRGGAVFVFINRTRNLIIHLHSRQHIRCLTLGHPGVRSDARMSSCQKWREGRGWTLGGGTAPLFEAGPSILRGSGARVANGILSAVRPPRWLGFACAFRLRKMPRGRKDPGWGSIFPA